MIKKFNPIAIQGASEASSAAPSTSCLFAECPGLIQQSPLMLRGSLAAFTKWRSLLMSPLSHRGLASGLHKVAETTDDPSESAGLASGLLYVLEPTDDPSEVAGLASGI